MTQGNGSGGQQSLMERVLKALPNVAVAAVPQGAERRAKGEKIVAQCDDFLKRLHSYGSQLRHEIEPLRAEVGEIERTLIDALSGLNRRTDAATLFMELSGLVTPELQRKAERLRELKHKIDPQQYYLKWVVDYFWDEARNRFPELYNHPNIAVRSDWSIVESEERHEHHHSLGDLLGGILSHPGHRDRLDA
jgi:hypothetical protein